jgi:hypothetical protein
MGEKGMHREFWWGNQKERYHYEDLDVFFFIWWGGT